MRGLPLVLAGTLWLAASPALAEVRVVPDDFDSIQAALDSSGPCDVVEVRAGFYAEQLYVPGGVSLRADTSAGDVTVDAGGVDDKGAPIPQVVTLSGGSSIEGFVLQSAAEGVTVTGNWSVVRDNTMRSVEIGVTVSGATGYLVGNRIEAPSQKGVEAVGAQIWLDDNIILEAPTGVSLYQSTGRLLGNRVEQGGIGLDLTESLVEVTELTVEGNDVGVSLASGDVLLQASVFSENLVGLQVVGGNPLVLDNEFSGNDFGIRTLFADARIVTNRIETSSFVGIADGVGSTSVVLNNLLLDNVQGFVGQLAETEFFNNVVSGGERSVTVQGGSPNFVNNVFTGASVVGVDANQGPTALASFNLYWDNAVDTAALVSDGTDRFDDPQLDDDFLPLAGSPLVDNGNPAPSFEDVDGTPSDIGLSGGPSALDAYSPPGPLPPTAGDQQLYEVQEGQPTPIFVSNIVDATNDPVAFSWDLDPSDGLTWCDGFTNAVDFTAPDEGTYILSVRGEDSEGFEVTAEVTVEAYNAAPELWFDLVGTLEEGTEVQIFTEVNDPAEGDVVTVSIDADGDGIYEHAGIEPGFAGWTPQQSGAFTMAVQASDEDGGETVQTQEIFVANLPPFLADEPPVELTVGQEMSYPLPVEDPSPLDTVSVALEEGPEGMTLDGLVLSWTPTLAQEGVQPYTLFLVDSEGASVTLYLRISVFREGACSCSSAAAPGRSLSLSIVLLLLAVLARRRPRGRVQSSAARTA